MFTLLLIVFFTLLISANCSLFESVLYSSRPGTLEAAKRRQESKQSAEQMIEMKKHISRPIAAILILNTLANTAGATLAGAYAGTVLPPWMVPVFSIVFTLAILFLSEIMPKTMGALRWRKIWPFIVTPLRLMQVVLKPMIVITEKFTALFSSDDKVSAITEDEILAIVHMGTREGEISKEEGAIVRNIIQLENITVREIMTPRRVAFMLNAKSTIKDAAELVEGTPHSRIPLYEKNRENIVGYALHKDVTSAKNAANPELRLKDLLKPITFVKDSTNCLFLLTSFLKHRRHIAIVTDDYNGVDGLVTLEDLMETMLGSEIVDETDQVVDLQEAARRKAYKDSSETSAE